MNTCVIPDKERSAYWDNIKGILIILVVFAHILYQLQHTSGVIDAAVDYIYLFHMPAFVFVSGFFGKSGKSGKAGSIIKLVFLFFIFNSITVFIEGYTSYLEPIYSYWYLIALIVWRISTPRIAKLKGITVCLFVLALMTGYFPAIDNHFAISRIIGFFPFYMLGYKFSEEKSMEIINTGYAKRFAIGAVVLFGAGSVAYAARTVLGFTDDDLKIFAYDDPKDIIRRAVIFTIAFLIIFSIGCLSVNRKVPLLTMFGRNSLWIFVFHRMFTIWTSRYLMKSLSTPLKFVVATVIALVLCIAFGNDFVAKFMNRFLAAGADIFLTNKKKITLAKVISVLVILGFVALAVFNAVKGIKAAREAENTPDENIIYPVMTPEQKEAYDNSLRITFAGDLILLEDQVALGYNGEGYDYSDVFEYAEPYISSADLAIGVLEGPLAGADKGYSTGNFDDGKPLCLNFPDEFASAIQDAGFDLVTTANNHLMDKGEEGAWRTLDVLDGIGLEHTGSYRSLEDKQQTHVKLIECEGVKIAVLSYTFGSNYIDTEELTDGQYSYITSVIRGTDGAKFEKLRSDVEEDFRQAKSLSPDLILVLPHIGTQFSNEADKEQEVWFEIFKENGADIILGDHPHAVEPVTIEEYNGRNVFTAYCPGNFANIYREDQGDTSMLIDVYVDRDSKQVTGGSIVPLYTYAPVDGNYRAVPIYEIMTNPEVRSHLTTDDIERAALANETITEVVFGHKMDITSITERYYFNGDGFIRSKTTGLVLTDDMTDGTWYGAMERAETICFIGDSVTAGNENGGCGWYEPIEEFFPDKTIINYSLGGVCVGYVVEFADEIPSADLYVIALGTNDVRYRNPDVCAMTSEEFVRQISVVKDSLQSRSPGAEFLFVAPWYSTEADPYCSLSFEEKTALNNEYSDALEKYCASNSLMFINANGYIKDVLDKSPDSVYLLDHIHPNSSKGVIMYTEAVLLSDKDT